MVLCQCKFISCNKCTTLVGDVDMGGCVRVGRGIWEISVHSSQFCCEPKTALKNNVLKKKQSQNQRTNERNKMCVKTECYLYY